MHGLDRTLSRRGLSRGAGWLAAGAAFAPRLALASAADEARDPNGTRMIDD